MPHDDSPSALPSRKSRTRHVISDARKQKSGSTPISPGDAHRAPHRRSRSHSSATGRSHPRRRSDTSSKIRREWVVGLLIVFMALCSILGFWALGKFRDIDNLPAVTAPVAAIPAEESVSEAPMEWSGPSPGKVADLFTQATTHGERLKLIRDPERVGPIMEAFFRDGPGAAETVKEVVPLDPITAGDFTYELYTVDFESEGPGRLLAVSVDPAGAKVDFECYARHSSVPIPDLVAGKAAEVEEIRLRMQGGTYYLGEFADESRWMHFKGVSADYPETLDLYMERTSPEAEEWFANGLSIFRATVSLRAVGESAKRRQFQITGVKAMDWIVPR